MRHFRRSIFASWRRHAGRADNPTLRDGILRKLAIHLKVEAWQFATPLRFSALVYWHPVKVRFCAVTLAPANGVSGVLVLVCAVCWSLLGRQSSVLPPPGTNATPSAV